MDLLFVLALVGFLTKHKGDVKLRNKLRIFALLFCDSSSWVIVKENYSL